MDVCELEHGRITSENYEGHPCYDMENLDVQLGERAGYNSSHTDSFLYIVGHTANFAGSEEIAAMASSEKDPDLCICVYDDGRFTTNTEENSCKNGDYSYAKILGLDEDENCMCC